METISDQLHKPCNHIWNSRSNGLHLLQELIPIYNVSICICYISYVEYYKYWGLEAYFIIIYHKLIDTIWPIIYISLKEKVCKRIFFF